MCPENVDKLCSMLCSVTDVHQYLAEHTDRAAFVCRDQIAVLRHRTQKASRFKRNRLAARVGAGDDHRVVSAAQCDVYRNDHSRIDERVARTHQD